MDTPAENRARPVQVQTTIPQFKKASGDFSPYTNSESSKIVSYPKAPSGADWEICATFVNDWKNWAYNAHSVDDVRSYERMEKQLSKYRPEGMAPVLDEISLFEGDFRRVPYPKIRTESTNVLSSFVLSWVNWGWSARQNAAVRSYERMEGHIRKVRDAQSRAAADARAGAAAPMPEGAAVDVVTA